MGIGIGGTAPTPTAGPAVAAVADISAVSRIALQAQANSSGVTTTTVAPQQTTLPFGLSRPAVPDKEDKVTDPQALMSKRVEAATQAMEVSKMIARRSVNFDDEKLMRKLISKGLKFDRQWNTAYTEYCATRGVKQGDEKSQSKDFIANFIERNLANAINQEWVKRL